MAYCPRSTNDSISNSDVPGPPVNRSVQPALRAGPNATEPGGAPRLQFRFVRPLPEVIPIKYKPDYRTDRIGRYAGGQFFADVTGASPTAGEPDFKRTYALLHLFDDEGRHLGSQIHCAGKLPLAYYKLPLDFTLPRPDLLGQAEEVLTRWLEDLGPVTYCDIAIRPFKVDFEGDTIGLLDETTDDPYHTHGCPWAELYPQRLGFHEPWDGEYDT